MILFESWQELARTLGSALLLYPFIILGVRVAGKRSTSKMNNFDWIVTVALGAIVGSTVILKDVVLLEAYLAIALLLGLQFALTKAAAHWPAVSSVVRDKSTLLFYAGAFDEQMMVQERVTRKEIESSAREAGFGDLSKVRAVILEADSSFSVLGREGGGFDGRAGDANDLLSEVEGQRRNGQD